MIIYKVQENGQATDFQFSKACPDGWLSIDSDKIPKDLSKYNSDAFNDQETAKKEDGRKAQTA